MSARTSYAAQGAPAPHVRQAVSEAIATPGISLGQAGHPARTAVPGHAMSTPRFSVIGGRNDAAEIDADRAAGHDGESMSRTRTLGEIRIHADQAAGRAAKLLGADAFALGAHIVFARDRFHPGSATGRRLLTHELNHVAANEPGVLRRYESFEHRQIGDKFLEDLQQFLATPEGAAWAGTTGNDAMALLAAMKGDPAAPGKKIRLENGLDLTAGEIIALMGDFYGSWQALARAKPGEIRATQNVSTNGGEKPGASPSPGILDIVDRELARGHATGEDNAAYESITGGRYLKLAQTNRPHFAGSGERFDKGNQGTWRAMHLEAVAAAKAAGPGADSEEGFQRALLIDAAAGHFLTDAFASGHLFDVLEVEAAILRHLQANPIKAQNPELQTTLAGINSAGLAYKLVLKNVHDRMNREGFDVKNARGMQWKTFGDNALKNAVETQRLAALAVFLSRMQIVQARSGKDVNPDDILALLPDQDTVRAATAKAISLIPDAVREVPALINSQLGVLTGKSLPWYLGGPILPRLGGSILSNSTDPGREKQLLDLKEREESLKSGPLIAPQFRVLEF